MDIIRKEFKKFIEENGHPPSFCHTQIRFVDNGLTSEADIQMSCDCDPEIEDLILYFCNSLDDLCALADESSGMDFVIIPESVSFSDVI